MRGSYGESERSESSDFGPRGPLRARPSAWLVSYYSVRTAPLSHMIGAGHVFTFDSVGVRASQPARRLMTATFDIDRKIRFIRVTKRFHAPPSHGIVSSVPTNQDAAVPVPTHIDPDVITRGAIETRRHLQTFDKRYQGKAIATSKGRGESFTLASCGPLAAALVAGFFGGGLGAAAYERGFYSAWAQLWISAPAIQQAAVTADLAQHGPFVIAAYDAATQPAVTPVAPLVDAPKTSARSASAALSPVVDSEPRSPDLRTPAADATAARKNRAEATMKKQRANLAPRSIRNTAGRPRDGHVADGSRETPYNFLETLAHSLKGLQRRAGP
jgi:hypothetical protein